jgi:signal transduction histidine kinase
MEVSEDGRGGAVIGAGEGEGSGLQGLTDRLAVIGGSLTVDSPPGRGTTVVAQAPRAAAIR